MIGELAAVVLGVSYANLIEWISHKYVLHGLGRKKESFWVFHWHHHGRCRRSGNRDNEYERGMLAKPNVKETLGLSLLLIAHVPLATLSPGFTLGALGSGVAYLVLHRYSHLHPDWGKRWMPHHWDHHMGKNQDANFCVTWPLWDWILGTRIKYH